MGGNTRRSGRTKPDTRRLGRAGIAIVVVLVAAMASPDKASAQGSGPTAVLNVRSANGDVTKLKHLVFIVQENRSFDQYFGAYPGADGITFDANGVATACLPTGTSAPCVRPYHNSSDRNIGGPHDMTASTADIDGGAMDGFLPAMLATNDNALCPPGYQPCRPFSTDTVGFHDAEEIPNYWSYADNFVLQDHLFESVSSWSAPAHVSLVSGWAATCATANDPYSCESNVDRTDWPASPVYAQTDITRLLYGAGVSWGYYVTSGLQPDCEDPATTGACPAVAQSSSTPSKWNPLPAFSTVNEDGQASNIQDTSAFHAAAADGTLPAVSWVIPNDAVSEHPTASVHAGQAYVTDLINTLMSGPEWDSTAVFVTWDDWGGFYDHVVPPTLDGNGVGLRVPGLVISPYAKQGYIDHQPLTFDSYLRLIEDVFLGGERLDPSTDMRPDPRLDVRETSPLTGDLRDDFDFAQSPRKPMLLPTSPAPGPGYRTYVPSVHDPGAAAPSTNTTQTATPLQGEAPFDVIFSGAGSLSGLNNIASWTLDFGDGTSAGGAGAPVDDINHRYLNAATYTATLQVQDTGGVTDTSTVTVNTAQPMPRAWINGPGVGVAPFDATYDLSRSDAGHWVLSFGDGSPDVSGDGAEPSAITHRYDTPGFDTVTLTVTDSNNQTSTTSSTVRIDLPTVPVARTSAPGLVGPDYAYLRGGVGPEDLPTTYWYEWGPTTAYGNATAPQTLSDYHHDYRFGPTALTGLDALTTYHFRLVAQNAAGTTFGNDVVFTTTGAPTITHRPATNITPTQADLSIDYNPQNSPSTYHLEWGTTLNYGNQSAETNGGWTDPATTLTITGLNPDTRYHWRLVATNAAGTVFGPDNVFASAGPPTAATTAASAIAASSATVNGWVDPYHAATVYWFQYSRTAHQLTSTTPQVAVGAGATRINVSATLTGLTPGQAYRYRIVAQNQYGTVNGPILTFVAA
jgi:phospholipase C